MSVSIVIPGIRHHLWPNVCQTLKESVGQLDWEVIFIGPFAPPKECEVYPINFIKSYSSVPVCIQKGMLEAKNELCYHTTDDGVFLKDSIKKCVDFFNMSCGEKDIVNMRYSEGQNFTGHIQTDEEWEVRNHKEFWLPCVNPNWKLAVQPLMYTDYFIYMGGLECSFVYSNGSWHDLMFRCQSYGSKIFHSPIGVAKFSHMPGISGDHKPIHESQIYIDDPKFNKMWSQLRNPIIDLLNYREYDRPWGRFSKEYNSYREMCEGEGYV